MERRNVDAAVRPRAHQPLRIGIDVGDGDSGAMAIAGHLAEIVAGELVDHRIAFGGGSHQQHAHFAIGRGGQLDEAHIGEADRLRLGQEARGRDVGLELLHRFEVIGDQRCRFAPAFELDGQIATRLVEVAAHAIEIEVAVVGRLPPVGERRAVGVPHADHHRNHLRDIADRREDEAAVAADRNVDRRMHLPIHIDGCEAFEDIRRHLARHR